MFNWFYKRFRLLYFVKQCLKKIFMKKELHLNTATALLFGLFLFFLMPITSFGQSIGKPTIVPGGGPFKISFEVTNGNGNAKYFKTTTVYTVYLSDMSGYNFTAIHSFTTPTAPRENNDEKATISNITIPIPDSYPSGSGYKLYIVSTNPVATSINSDAFTLFCDFNIPASDSGFIKSASPSITYYLITIINTGNLIDKYTLSKTQTGSVLTSEFYSLSGSIINQTPNLDPGESYTFMIRFDTPNGTPPDFWNYTTIRATSIKCNIIKITLLSTYIYGGNGNPNLPNAPDLEISKTANTATATVGDEITYTITIYNSSTKTALNPTIKDIIPLGVDLISYVKSPTETRNVLFSYNTGTRTLIAILQSSVTNVSGPLTIIVKARANCNGVPSVSNTAEVSSVSGDSNLNNDSSTALTAINYNLTGAEIGKWTGANNTDWFDCRNWPDGVLPTNSIDVIIPALSTRNVTIDPNSISAPPDKIARSRNMTIEIGKTLSLNNIANLWVSGNWINNGIFNPGNGTVSFNGSIANQYQTINKTETFFNLTINTTNSAKGLAIDDGLGLFINNNLNLINGDLRLFGKAQLIQTKVGISANSLIGTGKLFKDQQGQSSKFNYNYWSSPVYSAVSGVNYMYNVEDVLKDGSNPLNPQNIIWINGFDGASTNPISIARKWIYKFENKDDLGNNWDFIGEKSMLFALQGFTMKGSGSSSTAQNYTFVGKPNDGLLSRPIDFNKMYLVGNPYPSALDAYDFIDDNINSITGTLYFWEQYNTSHSHYTAQYEGRYVTLNKLGVTTTVIPPGISPIGSSTRIPGRYIPVGQGFLVYGKVNGGILKFDNNQREFVKEDESNSNPIFRTTNSKKSIQPYPIIRLGFKTDNSVDFYRQLLVGFIKDVASDKFDAGYDAIQIDTQKSDSYFMLDQLKLVIQGKGQFSEKAIIPIGVTVEQNQKVTFSLDGVDNINPNQAIYLFDDARKQYHNLKDGIVELMLDKGTYNHRFSLRFTNLIINNIQNDSNDLRVYYSKSNQILNLINPNKQTDVHTVRLFNILGQELASWKISNQQHPLIELSTKPLKTGIYLVNIKTTTTETTRKISVE